MGGSWQRVRLLSCRIKAAGLKARGGAEGREADATDQMEPYLF